MGDAYALSEDVVLGATISVAREALRVAPTLPIRRSGGCLGSARLGQPLSRPARTQHSPCSARAAFIKGPAGAPADTSFSDRWRQFATHPRAMPQQLAAGRNSEFCRRREEWLGTGSSLFWIHAGERCGQYLSRILGDLKASASSRCASTDDKRRASVASMRPRSASP